MSKVRLSVIKDVDAPRRWYMFWRRERRSHSPYHESSVRILCY